MREPTSHGEWDTISHDATFKMGLCIICFEKIAAKRGVAHALRVITGILGKTAALPGLRLQPGEGKECLKQV